MKLSLLIKRLENILKTEGDIDCGKIYYYFDTDFDKENEIYDLHFEIEEHPLDKKKKFLNFEL